MNRYTTPLAANYIALLIAVVVAFSSTNNVQGALLKSYDFNGDLTDTLGNGVDLVSLGGTLGGGRYSFLGNQGLRLDPALPGPDYAIEMRFQMNDSLNAYNKILDFTQLTADLGLYILNGQINYYGITGAYAPAPGTVGLNSDFTIGVVRVGGSIEVFLNGVSQYTAADPSDYTNPSPSILNFFIDDGAYGGEFFEGSVDFIRIHNDASTFGTAPIPEPSTLLFAALGGMVLLRVVPRQQRRVAGI